MGSRPVSDDGDMTPHTNVRTRRSNLRSLLAPNLLSLFAPLVALAAGMILLGTSAGASSVHYSFATASPTDGSTVSGAVQWSPSTPGWTPTRVEYSIDGSRTWTQTGGPYGETLDTTKLSNGSHTLSMTAAVGGGRGNGNTLTSTVTVNVSNSVATAPSSSGAPSVSGTAVVGQVLTATPGTWSGSTPISDTFQWARCGSSGDSCSQISGATAAAYALKSADSGSTLRVVVVASNQVGSSSATSAAVGPVTGVTSSPAPPYTVTQSIQNGSTISGAVQWTAVPSSVSLTKQVAFSVDGSLVSTETQSPYGAPSDTSPFDTTKLSNGSHVFKAVATETDGVTQASATATVTVSNKAATPPTTTTPTTTTPTTTTTSTTPTPTPTSAPTLFVSTTGSDARSCTQSAPCASLARAYAVAGAGAVVQVAPGSYGAQTMSANNGSVSSSQPVVFQSPAGAGVGDVVIEQLNLTGSDNVTFKTMTFGTGAPGNKAWYQRFSSNTLCDGCYIHGQLAIDGDDSNITFKNGTVGNYVAGNADPQIGAERGPSVTNAAQPTNVSFINESFHDIDASSTGTHTECLQVLAVHGLTIDHSTFFNCNVHGNGSKANIMFSGYDHNVGCVNEATCGTNNDYWDITIQNSSFNGGPAGSNQLAFQWDNQFDDSYDCRNVLVQNNSIVGGVLWGCNVNPPAETQVLRNSISLSGGFYSSQCNAVFKGNTWGRGSGCPQS